MKKRSKIFTMMIVVSFALSLQVSQIFAVSIPDVAISHIPVKADNVEIVKKATIKGAQAKPTKAQSLASTGKIGASLPVTGTKYAIIIGISDYPGTSSDLDYGDDDALAVKNSLINQYHFDEKNITLLTDTVTTKPEMKPTGTNIKNAIAKYSSMTSNDELVFFYSGHGAKGRAADGDSSNTDQAIVVWKGLTDAEGFDYLWDGELKQWFNEYHANGRIIFAFDSCLSGGMSVLNVNALNRVVTMGCTATGYSYEGTQWGGGHGQFTYYLIMQGLGMALAQGSNVFLADTNKDGKVTVEESFDYTKANCLYQTPTIADGFNDDLYLDYISLP